jgi:hypothetical protein
VVVARGGVEVAFGGLCLGLGVGVWVVWGRIAAPVKHADNAAIARRAELADQARELRREYERLVR